VPNLSRFLLDRDGQVFEVGRLRRERRSGGKTDALDAIRAARSLLTQKRGAANDRRTAFVCTNRVSSNAPSSPSCSQQNEMSAGPASWGTRAASPTTDG
jgi:hypothetical protein